MFKVSKSHASSCLARNRFYIHQHNEKHKLRGHNMQLNSKHGLVQECENLVNWEGSDRKSVV